MLTPLRSLSPVLVMISSMSVSICNHFRAKQANSSKIMSLRGCPSFYPSFEGTPLTQQHKILSRNATDSTVSYGKNLKALSLLVLDQYQVMTDRRTDRQTELPYSLCVMKCIPFISTASDNSFCLFFIITELKCSTKKITHKLLIFCKCTQLMV